MANWWPFHFSGSQDAASVAPSGASVAAGSDQPQRLPGRHTFRFRYFWTGTYYRIDILLQPSYGDRSTDVHVIHRLGGPGGYYVCTTLSPATLELAREIARQWAKRTLRYIATGKPVHED